MTDKKIHLSTEHERKQCQSIHSEYYQLYLTIVKIDTIN